MRAAADADGAASRPLPPPWRPPARDALLAVLLWLAVKLVTVLAVAAEAARAGRPWWPQLGRHDGGWYLGIAAHGYRSDAPGPADPLRFKDLAFFPGYPGLVRLTARALGVPLRPADLLPVAVGVSCVAGLVAAWGLFELGRRVDGPRAGIVLAGLWAALPSSVVQVMAYTESLFTALAVWAIVALLARRWLLAAALCCGAGLVRATGAAVVVAVWVAAAAAVLAVVRCRGPARADLRALAVPVAAAVLAPAGLLLHVVDVALRTGRPDGYLWVQHDLWGTWFDGGAFTLATLRAAPASLPSTEPRVVAGTVVAAAAALLLLARRRPPGPVLAYTVVVLVMCVGARGFLQSKARLLLPAVPLLLPAAVSLAVRWRRAVPLLVVVACLGAAYSAYLVVHWRFSF